MRLFGLLTIGSVQLHAALVLAILGTNTLCYAQVKHELIALTPSWSQPDFYGYQFQSLSVPSISDDGTVVFRSSVYSITDPGPNRIFTTAAPGVYNQIVKQGDSAPGTAGATFMSFLMAQISGDGQLAFYGYLQGTDVNTANDTGLWAWDESTGLRAVGIEGQTAPGTQYTFLLFDDLDTARRAPGFVQSQSGRVAFWQQVIDPNDPTIIHRGIWAEDENRELQLVALTGQPVPGVAGGTRFTHFSSGLPQMTDDGLLVFQAFAAEPEDSLLGTEAIWRQRTDGGFDKIVSAGDPAPGATGGIFWAFENFNINGNSQMAFQAAVEIPGVGYQNGIWTVDENGDISTVVLNSQSAPGIPGGVFDHFLSVDRPFVIDNAGSIVFTASLTGPGIDESNDTGLWRMRSNGSVELVAWENAPAPGGGNFGTFNDDSPRVSNSTITMNSLGQMAFTTDDSALWAEDSSGQLQLIARVGQEIDFDPGPGVDIRTISSVYMLNTSNGQDGLARPFNDNGDLVFLVGLQQWGYAVIRVNMNTVPEPGLISLLATVLLSSVASRKMR
jgi:hypothetical protein